VRVRAGRTLRPQKHPFGYLSVTLCNGGAKSIQRIHTLVARAFIGERPTENHVVAHNNGVANDNRLQNLRYATQSENLLDMRLHGTSLRGERNGNTPLSPGDVLAMRKARGQGVLLRELAQHYGVCKSTVSNICNRLTWKHL
jgi:lambda repressor-like predicted transcriptional regulator